MIKIHRSNHRIRPFSSQTHGERLRQSVVESRRNRPTLRKWSLEIEKVGSMSVRCAPSPLRTATAGGARSMPTIHILSPIVDNLSTFYPHSIHILSTFYPHSIHILSTYPIAHAVCPAPRKVARALRDKGRDGCLPLCVCCQFVSCWWEAIGVRAVGRVPVRACGVLPAPSMGLGWWCRLVRVQR